MSHGTLLGQSLAGDESAFETLVSRYRSPLLNYIRSILKDDELAYDVLQFVLLQLSVSQPKLSRNIPLRAWMFQVARNRCLDELRKRKGKPAVHFSELLLECESGEISQLESIQDARPLREEIVELRDLYSILQQAICDLPPRFQRVVHLRCFMELPFSEIGRILKMPEATAKTYYYRAYRALPHLCSALGQGI
jgi:RNA polymerase sigma factor (sigma-70 family)